MATFSVSKDSGYGDGLEQILKGVNRLPTQDKAGFEVEVEEVPAEEPDKWPKPNVTFITQQAVRLRISLCCRLCGKKDVPARFVLCSGCGAAHMPAHRQCLLNTRDHQPESEEPPEFGDPCEEIDFQQWIFVSWLLDSKIPDEEKSALHVNDLWSTWFGVPEDQEGHCPQLCIYPRLERLVEKVLEKPQFQYPSLISFVGDTGSGKSTLIRAIIESLAPGKRYQVPVQGAVQDKFKSTSSDVRLFADPQTESSEVPRFFVDCEGFNGSDNPVSQLQQEWEIRGRSIKTAEELIRCYYDDFQVISIPQLTRSSPAIVQNISDQIKALYSEIIAMSEKIRGKRKSFNLDLDTSSLNAYLHRSAMALGRDYQDSLDFHELSDGDVAPPRRFSEHLAQLMARMAKQRNFDTIQAVKGESQLVLQMTPYIAACIVAQIDPMGGKEHERQRKEDLVDEAIRGLKQFRDCSWRCEEQGRGERRWARILALDGGGVRGIVELVILAKIEKAVGFGIRIQDLFDLVVGTSTGGLVVLGVFEKKWPLSDAIDHFCRLAKEAFSLRKVLALPGLSLLAEPFCVFKYKSSGINNALRTAFGEEDYLFGQIKDGEQSGDQVKVGVVTCLDGNNHPCLLANDSRNPIEKLKDGREAYDCLQRADEQGKDFQTWAAARATSAAQTLFKPYIHEATRRVYVDGATVRNNPVRLAAEEATRIWKSSSPPDIILSLGTGIWIDEKCKYVEKPPSKIGRLLPKGIKKKIETGIDMVYATLDCDREWTDFNGPLRGRYKRNCHRLNVGLYEKPPALDDIEHLVDIQTMSKTANSRPGITSPSSLNTSSHLSSTSR
ncbi:hypothetical protein CEP52_013763 [Fusarium oligoseptatum]|uniref:PNPLA domain-containing protein n=1 Tax=Fusarium oligoseptatum TaxID=2604345 RepID=A0A428SRU4_9HYPO|nr:hypothetical protein CEP52_013763 [Fusarium oligoseptatum]